MPTVLVVANSSRSMGNLYTFMLLLATSATLVMYLAVALAGIVLPRGGRMGAAAAANRWLPAVGAFAALYSVWTIAGAGAEAFWWCLALLAAGVPVYAWQRRRGGAAAPPAATSFPPG